MIQRDEPAEDWLFPDRQAHAVPILQRKRRLLVGEAELLRLRPELDDIGGRDAGANGVDASIQNVAAFLVSVHHPLRRAADGERPVVTGAVARVAVQNVEVSLVARPHGAVAAYLPMWT